MYMLPLLTVALAAATAPTTEKPAAPPVRTALAEPLTKAQFLKLIDARFVAMDANKDGQLSRQEIEAAEAKAQAQRLTALNQRREAAFKKLDTNKDGQLNLAEFNAGAPIPPQPKPDGSKAMVRMDGNKDQVVTIQEYRAGPNADFDKLDANKDGRLSPQERAAARPAKQ